MDKWILSRLIRSVDAVANALDKYDSPDAVSLIKQFVVGDLSTWYVRRTRDRIGPNSPDGKDKDEAYQTLWLVLTEYSKAIASIIPFISEEIYRNLTGKESVHLESWPDVDAGWKNDEIEEDMTRVRVIVEQAHAIRKSHNIKVRQPLGKLSVSNIKRQIPDPMAQVIKDELNVKEVNFVKGDGEMSVDLDIQLTPELIAEGQARDLVREIQDARKQAGTVLNEKIVVYLPDYPIDFEEYIKTKTLAIKLLSGPAIRVEKVKP